MNETVLRLAVGAVRGETIGNVEHFLGIPYAAPPVAERRFAAPQPVARWDGMRDCRVAGANAPQRIRDVPGIDVRALVGDGWVAGDDYLTLNIWRPAGGVQDLPVMVFIHGGGFVIGSKDAPVQNGSSFARDGLICVAINYRMGIDGFLPIPGVPTNLGLRDMIAALRWVRDNAAAIGGDAGNVTVSDVRRTLELRTAELAATQRSDKDARAILAHADAMAASNDDLPLLIRHDIAFHQSIASASGNALFHNIVRSFEALMAVAVPTAWQTRATEDQRRSVLNQHRRLALTIADRDPVAAHDEMNRHFDTSIGDIFRAYAVAS